MSEGEGQIPEEEMERRVIYSLLLPAVRLARVFGIPIKDLSHYLQMAYFQELRSDGLTLKASSKRMDISMRTAARLSKQLKVNFFRPEREHELPRRIEFMLWHEPLSMVRIKRELPEVDDQRVEEAVMQLLAEERIVRNGGRTETFGITTGERRIVRDRWTARIGALNALVGTVCNAAYGRFFAGSPTAFARTLSFRLRDKDVTALQQIYEEAIFNTLKELEKNAADDPSAKRMNLSLLWAEYESIPSTQTSKINDDHKLDE